MTAAITAPTETSEPLAPAGQAAAPGRGPAGAFDLLIALLQTQLPPMPGVPTSVVATPVGPTPALAGAVNLGTLVNDATVTGDAAGLLQAATIPELGDLLVSDDGTVAEDDEDALDEADLSPLAAAAALAAQLLPLTSDTRALPTIEDGGLARQIATTPDIGQATSEAAVAALEAARTAIADAEAQQPVEAMQASAGDEPLASPDAGAAVPLEPRSRLDRSMRTVDAFRAAEAAAALASVREEVAQRLGATSSMPRVTAAAEALVDRFGGPSPEIERDGPGPNADSSVGAAPIPSALAPREADAVAETHRPDPVRDPIDQIATRLRDVRGPGRHEISVRLDPPELGAVRIDARLDGARLSLSIVAEHAPTGELLADALPRLRETLSQQGFVPANVTVHLGFEAAGRQFTRDDAPTFTPPRDGELAPASPVVRLPAARAAVTSDGLDVWA
jgi:flagellar hook-length control protein FliK